MAMGLFQETQGGMRWPSLTFDKLDDEFYDGAGGSADPGRYRRWTPPPIRWRSCAKRVKETLY